MTLKGAQGLKSYNFGCSSLFLTFTYRDFTFIVLVFSIIVDTCIAGPVRVVVGPALNTVMSVMLVLGLGLGP